MAAAENESGGGASEGMGLGMGFAMANQMVQGMGQAGRPGMAPPPPPVSAWYIAVNGKTEGPFDVNQMAHGAQAGQVGRETLVWSQSLGEWKPASQVGALGMIFGPPPPPPPPAP